MAADIRLGNNRLAWLSIHVKDTEFFRARATRFAEYEPYIRTRWRNYLGSHRDRSLTRISYLLCIAKKLHTSAYFTRSTEI